MSKKYFSLLIIFLLSNSVFAQNNKQEGSISNPRILSYQELLNEMASCKDSMYILKNATIKFDLIRDGRFIKGQDSIVRAQLDTIYVKAKILLDNIKFERNSGGRLQPVFLKVDFAKEVKILQSKVEERLSFFDCTFKSTLEIRIHKESRDSRIYLDNSTLNSYSRFIHKNGSMIFLECLFDPINKQDLDNFNFTTADVESSVMFYNNKFIRRDSIGGSYIWGNAYTLRFWDNIFETDLHFPEMSIDDITMIGNKFLGLIDMTNVEFGSYKSELYYEQLGGKIGVYSNEDDGIKAWRPKTFESFSDSIAAERFFNVYRRVTDHFRNRGNLKDYNKMFIEMKDFETMQLHYYFEKEKSIASWFSWKMNLFLGIFSDYGTSPIKAVLYAIKVILIFALFFFFFHNDWDTFTKEKLMARMRLLTKYFRSNDGIAKLYEEQERHRYKNYEDFITAMQDSKHEIPKMFLWISKPLYALSTYKIKASNKFLQKAEILNGKWLELEGPKKALTSVSVSIVLVFYLISSLIMKVLNALMLSINTFTTLGFGEIPTRGIGRYAAIIEGFVGWFLLTLFSVSLITQLLQ